MRKRPGEPRLTRSRVRTGTVGTDEYTKEVTMWPVMPCLSVGAVQASAIFVSGLQRGDELSADQVRQAVAEAIHAFGYSGCAGRVRSSSAIIPKRR